MGLLKWTDEATLRRLAEETLVDRTQPPDSGASYDALVHELRVHQTELEMQNETLREAQFELQRSEERFRDFFENAPTGYLVMDESGRIELANARAAEILGMTARELRGTRLSKYLLPEEAVPYEQHRREVIRTSTHLTAEFTFVAGGRRREVQLESVRSDPQEGKWRVALVDVTAPNSVARKLNHSERLDAVGRHASGVAHDLGNLLFSIAGHADIALNYLLPDHPARAAVVALREVVKRGADRTEQLATFSRSEGEQSSIVDLNMVIVDMENALRGVLGQDIELGLDLDAADASVRMDPAQVEQVLLSVARNARQAMPHGGTFTIATSSVELGGPTTSRSIVSARCVRWAMKDTGVGMDEATRERALEPFFTTKPAGVGTGLGLSMVSAVVERAGGVVALESGLGRGTSLVIHLPRATGYAGRTPAPGSPPADAPPFSTVMVVEDNPEARDLIATRLRGAGCDVVLANGGIDALSQLRRLNSRVKLVLVDENLPGASLGELLRAIRAVSEKVEVLVTPLTTTNGEDPEVDIVAGTVLRALDAIRFENG